MFCPSFLFGIIQPPRNQHLLFPRHFSRWFSFSTGGICILSLEGTFFVVGSIFGFKPCGKKTQKVYKTWSTWTSLQIRCLARKSNELIPFTPPVVCSCNSCLTDIQSGKNGCLTAIRQLQPNWWIVVWRCVKGMLHGWFYFPCNSSAIWGSEESRTMELLIVDLTTGYVKQYHRELRNSLIK